jgi:hypothetical protein
MRAAMMAAALVICGGAALAQETQTPASRQVGAAASDWRVVECRRGADAKRAVRRQFGRLPYVTAREVLDGPRFEGARCMTELEYWRLGRALDLPAGRQFASIR